MPLDERAGFNRRTMGLSMGSLAAPTATGSAIARGGNRMLLSIPTPFQEERHLRDDGRSGSAGASGNQAQGRCLLGAPRMEGASTTNVGVPKTSSSISWFKNTSRPPGPSRAGDRAGLPEFVEEEFDAFLECGILAHGWGVTD
jgi:hypothetical protein